MRIEDHRLVGERTVFRPSPNQGGPFLPAFPDTIIIHYTATGDVESAVRVLSDPSRKVSAHLVVGRNGDVVQLVPFDTVAWHAGRSRWGDREGLNQYSLGIEIDNAGQLQEQEGRYVSWFGREYPQDQVVWGVHRHQIQSTPWHRFSRDQIVRVTQLCRLLISAYGIQHILGHEEIAPGRKIDPGPAFPLDGLRARLLSGELEPESGHGSSATVRARRLNLRSAPRGDSERLVGYLPQGTEVTVLEPRRDWSRVRLVLEGWASSRYLDSYAP